MISVDHQKQRFATTWPQTSAWLRILFEIVSPKLAELLLFRYFVCCSASSDFQHRHIKGNLVCTYSILQQFYHVLYWVSIFRESGVYSSYRFILNNDMFITVCWHNAFNKSYRWRIPQDPLYMTNIPVSMPQGYLQSDHVSMLGYRPLTGA